MSARLDRDASVTTRIEMEADRRLLDELPVVLTVGEVAAVIRRSRSRTYTLIQSGQLRSVKIGGSRRILRRDLELYLTRLENA